MTQITKIVMNGFKSFGKKTELLFGDKFNVILGPNGSGKSNVMDALIFVLGKSGSKGLRAEKSANLVYNGGKSKKPAKQGEVSIYFDNKSRIFPTEDDSVKITRIIKHSGQSVYKINDITRTRQQILDLLSIAKINPDGYNIILQGDIVKLVEMSSIERRQIVEEIAGISVYEEKKLKAVRELEKVDEKIGEAEIVLKERNAYLKDLKKDRDQALKYKELNDKIKQNKASYLKKQIEQKEAQKELLEKDMQRYKEQFEKVQKKINDWKEEIKQRKQQIDDISKEVEQKGETETVQLQKHIEDLRVSIATKHERINATQNEITKIDQRYEQLKVSLSETQGRTDTLKDRQKELREKEKRLEAIKKEVEQKINAFKEKNKMDDADELYKQIEALDKKAEEKQTNTQQLREEQQNLIREKDRIEFQITHMDEKIEKVVQIEQEHKQEIQALKQKQTELKKATQELNKILDQDAGLAKNLAEKRTLLLKIAEDIARLEAQKSHQKERANADLAVKKILENKSKFKGVYGTVADLGVVDKKYATALEVTAGKKINSIVVEDDATAAKCIQYLKQNRLGTAAFLPLNKIKAESLHPETKKLKNKEGVQGLAIDLISFDAKFHAVFSYVFGNTLIVESIEKARTIGIGKAKMTTLDGDVATLSGAMIGGYREKKKAGAFKEADVGKELDQLQEKSAQLQSQLQKATKEKEDNELKIAQLREFKATLEGDIIRSEKALHLDSSDLEASKAYKEELKQSLIEADKKLDATLEKISQENREIADLKIEKQKLRDTLSQLRNPRLLAELNAFEDQKTKLTQDIIQNTSELKNVEIQVKEILGRDAESTDKTMKEITKEKKRFGEEMQTLEKEVRQHKIDLKKKEQEQEKSHSKFKALYEKRNKLNDEINTLEQKIYSKEEDARKAEIKVNTLGLEQAKINAEHTALREEFNQYEGVELALHKSEEQLKKEINAFERMKENIGNVNLRALEIYDAVEKEYNALIEKKESLAKEKQSVLELMEEIEGKKKDLFMTSFNAVNTKFQEIFSQLTSKGEASLELENPEQPFEDGMSIKVRLSGNKFMDIRSLSGGEKTLTALAFIFAIQEHEPASFYIMDEVDAALDKRNAERLAKLVRKYSENAQYVVISHNDAVISEGDILYGVSMNEFGVSNIVSLKL